MRTKGYLERDIVDNSFEDRLPRHPTLLRLNSAPTTKTLCIVAEHGNQMHERADCLTPTTSSPRRCRNATAPQKYKPYQAKPRYQNLKKVNFQFYVTHMLHSFTTAKLGLSAFAHDLRRVLGKNACILNSYSLNTWFPPSADAGIDKIAVYARLANARRRCLKQVIPASEGFDHNCRTAAVKLNLNQPTDRSNKPSVEALSVGWWSAGGLRARR